MSDTHLERINRTINVIDSLQLTYMYMYIARFMLMRGTLIVGYFQLQNNRWRNQEEIVVAIVVVVVVVVVGEVVALIAVVELLVVIIVVEAVRI